MQHHVLSQLPPIPCPFPSLVHPAADLAEAHVRYYGRRFGLVTTPASGERFDRAGYGLFAARTSPTACDIELLAEWAAWLFVFDDEFDESGRPHERALLVDEVRDEVRAILTPDLGPPPRHPRNALTAALADMWPRTARRMTHGWRLRFAGHLCAFVDIYRTEIANRRFGDPPSFEHYLPFRRVIGAVDTCWDMIEAAQGESLPEDVVGHPLCQAVRLAANDVSCWTNDIISLNKEHARGDMNNIVAVLRHAHGLDWPEAAERAAGMVAVRTQDYLAARRALAESPVSTAHLERCLDAMSHWMAGSRMWHLWSHRYRDIEHAPPLEDPSYYDPLL
ncbi:terpene synthase family protein [Streptomyces bambusae]|uniref:terpene synthase family protein n=1 Tax=Streptomyces bambusae TaxID=1550616 RepID=UPI001CFDB769|nr:terpene synthase family protein [Streptomyces bambusae]MCB5167799.1 terpene synthase family protein [Streptomyces bambusae]